MTRFSILCPTRGRPDNVERMVRSVFDTAFYPRDVEVLLYVDDDDPTWEDLRSRVVAWNREGMTVRHRWGPRIVLSETWNALAHMARGEILAHSDDDVVYRTQSWDTMLAHEFENWPDRLVFVHGRDGVHDAAFGTHGFIHRRWVEVVGRFCPPYFSSDYNDTWLNDVANALNRRVYLAELYTEHMHPVVGKAPMDQTYEERLTRHRQDNVDQLYAEKVNERAAEVELFVAAIEAHAREAAGA